MASCAPFSSPEPRPEEPPEPTVLTEVAGGWVYALSEDGAVMCTLGSAMGAVCGPAAAPEGTPSTIWSWDADTQLVVAPHDDGSLQLCAPDGNRCVVVPFLDGMRAGQRLPAFARGDVNGDGFIDIVVGRPTSPDSTVVPPHICWGAALPGAVVCEALAIDGDHHAFAQLADLDEDGHLDLLLGAYDIDHWAAAPTVCFSAGAADLRCVSTPLPDDAVEDALAVDVRAHDIDGDGVLDRLVRFEPQYLQRPAWCPGTPDTLDPCQDNDILQISVPEFYYSDGNFYPVGVAVWEAVDLDADGDLDLVGGAGGGSLLDCRFDEGDYTCSELVETPCGGFDAHSQLSVLDLDGDADADVVMACSQDGRGVVVACLAGRAWTCDVLLDDENYWGAAAWPAVVTEVEVRE